MEVPSKHTGTTAERKLPSRRLSVAPMMDWTDRHCRVFHRQITRHTWLYTEMVTTGALVYGDVGRHLRYDGIEHPIALQSWASSGATTRST
jgi:tRNA-dihydrouridine synthase A